MKPNDKAIEAAIRYLEAPMSAREQMEQILTAAYAAQFPPSEDYAGLVKELRDAVDCHQCDETGEKAADALEAVLAERDRLKAELVDYKDAAASEADFVNELEEKIRELNVEIDKWESAYKEITDTRVKIEETTVDKLKKVESERDALAARLAPVDDEALVDIAVETWIEATTGLARRPSAYTISERAGARAAIAAIRPHIEAAERERCAKIAETPELWLTDKPTRGCDDIAATIRSGSGSVK